MKRKIGLLIMVLAVSLCAFALADVKIDGENFPDSVFREFIASEYDENEDGSLSAEEIESVREMSVSGMEIGNLKGVEYFTELRDLDCSDNHLIALGLSRLTKLVKLNCSYNRISKLNLSKNKALEELDCSENQLTSLDTSANPCLQDLDCSGNNIKRLDLSKNTLLSNLSADEDDDEKQTKVIQVDGEEILIGDYVFALDQSQDEHGYNTYEWVISDFIWQFLPRSLAEVRIPKEINGLPVRQPTALRDSVFGNTPDLTVNTQKTCGIFRYCPVSDTECYVIGISDRKFENVQYDKEDHVLYIPKKLDQYTVIGIADGFVASSGGYQDDDVAKAYILPDTIQYIGNNAFGYSAGMIIRLNEGLKYIADFAFTSHHPGVMILPISIEQIGKNPFHDDFDGGYNSPLYLFDTQGQPWESATGKYQVFNGSLYDMTEMRLITYLDQMEYVDGQYQSVKEYRVPDGTRVIGENAFIGTRDLIRVILPEGLEIIEKSAFYFCSCGSLTEIVIPASVTEIGKDSIDSDTKIICAKDSAAEAYAVENGNEIRYIQENEPLPESQPTSLALAAFEIDQATNREFVISLDADQDGTISREEILAQLQRDACKAEPELFTEEGVDYLKMTFTDYLRWAFDENQDGVLQWSEYKRYLSIYGISNRDIDIPLQ